MLLPISASSRSGGPTTASRAPPSGRRRRRTPTGRWGWVVWPTRCASRAHSHIYFVVRDDDGEAELLFQTSDTTWQAYNQYGGASTYGRLDRDDRGPRAYKVSYNRPFETRAYRAVNLVFNAEYPMVRWLEANGYDGAGASCGCRLTGGLPLSLPRRDPDPMPHPRRPRRPEARRSESSAVPSMTALTSRARVRA
ncbi:MAG TPA: N,N-dimethylformamidase beta subunit family domain-containing protein [Acidobacteriota bacterium]